MKARVLWQEHRTFVGESGSGHTVVMDGAPEHGGRDLAARPMEMLLLGMGGCSAFDVVGMLERARQPLDRLELEIEADRAEDIPQVFTRIHVLYRAFGNGLSEAQVRRAIDLSVTKYCSASLMLGETAEITYDLELIED